MIIVIFRFKMICIAFLFGFLGLWSCGNTNDTIVQKGEDNVQDQDPFDGGKSEDDRRNPPGKDDGKENDKEEPGNNQPKDDDNFDGNEPDVVEGNTIKILLEGNDAMQFTRKELKVREEQTVELTLRHAGKLSRAAMGHNFVLLASGTDLMAFGLTAGNARDNNYIPKSEMDKIIAYTDLIGGGESTKVTFKAPKKGTYDYVCSFPGHYALMNGKFIVE
jgi:azurin